MNLTMEHHEESRFTGAVFDWLAEALVTGGCPDGVSVRELYRAPGPPNCVFAIGFELEAEGRRGNQEFSVMAWPGPPDRTPESTAAALLVDLRACLTRAGAELASRPLPRRRWWRRS